MNDKIELIKKKANLADLLQERDVLRQKYDLENQRLSSEIAKIHAEVYDPQACVAK